MDARVCLIVDDEAAIRTCLRSILQHSRIRSLEADNLADARRIIERLDGQIDLVLIDIDLTHEPAGLELARWVKSSFPGIRVVVISENAEKAPAEFAFIPKPFHMQDVLRAVDPMRRKRSVSPDVRLLRVS
jgi:DNA-binding NtrC family response regulator